MTYDEIRRVGRNIRLHGNRFIQIDLDDNGQRRINVWSDAVPLAQRIPTPIHDHVFPYESTVISGTLLNVEYSLFAHDVGKGFSRAYACAPHRIYQGVRRDRQDTCLERLLADEIVHACVDCVKHYGQGQRYKWPAGWYHATAYVGHAVTLMERGPTELARPPRILVPDGCEPDNDFNRYQYDESHLWGIVAAIFHEFIR